MNDFWSWITALITTLIGILVGHSLSLSKAKSANIISEKNKLESLFVTYVEYAIANWDNNLNTQFYYYKMIFQQQSGIDISIVNKTFDIFILEKSKNSEYVGKLIETKKEIVQSIISLGNYKSKDLTEAVRKVTMIDSHFPKKLINEEMSKVGTDEGLLTMLSHLRRDIKEKIEELEVSYYEYFNEVKSMLSEKGISFGKFDIKEEDMDG